MWTCGSVAEQWSSVSDDVSPKHFKLTFACSLTGEKKKALKESSFMSSIIWIQKTFAKSEDDISKPEVTICSWLSKSEMDTKY